MPSSHAWIFQATPAVLALIEALRQGNTLDWSISRHARELRRGDRVYYWQSGRDAGIYGLGRVAAIGRREPDGRYAVTTLHERALFAPVTRGELRADPALRDMLVLRQPRGTVFPLSIAEDIALLRRTGGRALVIALPAAILKKTRCRLTPALAGDLIRRIALTHGQAAEVIVAGVEGSDVVRLARVGTLRQDDAGNLVLGLHDSPDLPHPPLSPQALEAIAEGRAVELDWAIAGAAEPGPAEPAMAVRETGAGYGRAARFVAVAEEVAGDLLLPAGLVEQLGAAINAGQHIVLMGLPGTGKTSLALNLARAAARQGLCAGPLLATATADWSTFDTVGGLVPHGDGTLRFAEGVALRAVHENRWLVLDELNRADIDKAFGPLLTVVSGGAVDLPALTVGGRPVRVEPGSHVCTVTDEGSVYRVGVDWRIIATMNTADRAALFSFSLAFARRFAFVLVAPPAPRELIELVGRRFPLESAMLGQLERLVLAAPRRLGPAIVLDVARYATARAGAPALAEALAAFVLPQLEGLERADLLAFVEEAVAILGPAAELPLLAYVNALYGDS